MNYVAMEIESANEIQSDVAPAIVELAELQLMLIGGGNVEVIVG